MKLLIFTLLVAVFHALALADEYPSCGSCWCVPDNGGLGACPDWQPTTVYNSSVISVYQKQAPSQIFTLSCNPYSDSMCSTIPAQTLLDVSSAVCAYKYPVDSETNTQSCTTYGMVTYPSSESALADGAVITHEGSCGLCSTTQDLSIYLIEDFTAAGKKCASIGLFDEDAGLNCYMNIGLTRECAKIWNYDGIYDGKACGKICASELTDPNNGPPPACALNDCLQCDEDKAGPIFSTFAGRTRRRSGLVSEIVRNCSSIAQITHDPCANPSCLC